MQPYMSTEILHLPKNQISDLPPEVWTLVAEQLACQSGSSKTLSKLALVRKSTYRPGVEQLFRKVHVDNSKRLGVFLASYRKYLSSISRKISPSQDDKVSWFDERVSPFNRIRAITLDFFPSPDDMKAIERTISLGRMKNTSKPYMSGINRTHLVHLKYSSLGGYYYGLRKEGYLQGATKYGLGWDMTRTGCSDWITDLFSPKTVKIEWDLACTTIDLKYNEKGEKQTTKVSYEFKNFPRPSFADSALLKQAELHFEHFESDLRVRFSRFTTKGKKDSKVPIVVSGIELEDFSLMMQQIRTEPFQGLERSELPEHERLSGWQSDSLQILAGR